MRLYQLAVSVILMIPFCIAVWNYFAFAVIRGDERPKYAPRVSVLVPARDEEATIGACVASLAAQQYPDFEVLVLDDGSEDRTAEIVQGIASWSPHVRLIPGAPLPQGWVGKSWACHQLAHAAGGDWLIFTDADTEHTPNSISAAIAFAERADVAFFSGIPLQTMPGLLEKVVVPTVIFLSFAYLPNRWITERLDPQFSATNGQLIGVTREAYVRIGGHEAVRAQIVEDVWMGRAAKRAGIRTALAAAIETVRCRTTARSVLAGFSKNLFPGLDYSLIGLLFFLITMLLLYVVPLVFVITSAINGNTTFALFWLPLGQVVIAALMRGLLALRFGMRWHQVFLHPLAALAMSVIALNSARLAFSRRGPTWKGRSYHRGG